MTDYYRLLEVHPEASPEVLEKAYKALCLKYHPDRHPEDKRQWANARMRELNEAYAVLSDAERRREYDLRRRGGVAGKIYENTGRDPQELLKVLWHRGLLGVAQTLLDDYPIRRP